MVRACNMAPSAAKASSLGQGSSKRVARRSSVPDANNRACSGVNPGPKTSWPCVASRPAIDSTPFGKTGSTPTPPATTASHSQPNRRILSYALPDLTDTNQLATFVNNGLTQTTEAYG